MKHREVSTTTAKNTTPTFSNSKFSHSTHRSYLDLTNRMKDKRLPLCVFLHTHTLTHTHTHLPSEPSVCSIITCVSLRTASRHEVSQPVGVMNRLWTAESTFCQAVYVDGGKLPQNRKEKLITTFLNQHSSLVNFKVQWCMTESSIRKEARNYWLVFQFDFHQEGLVTKNNKKKNQKTNYRHLSCRKLVCFYFDPSSTTSMILYLGYLPKKVTQIRFQG